MHGASVSALLTGVIGLICVTHAVCTAGAEPASSGCHRTSLTRGSPERRNTSRFSATLRSPVCIVDRIKFLPGMKVMPHWHPDTVRTVLVISGTFYFAVGEQWDEGKLKAYPAGTCILNPRKRRTMDGRRTAR